MNINLTSLTLRNFLSTGQITQAVKLDQPGLILILGQNPDLGDGAKNGVGKSTILQAISYALYGKPLTKIKIPNLVNNINGKGMVVTLEFTKGDRKYRIERARKPDSMKFFMDGTEFLEEMDIAQGENRHTQEEIERIIGMSHSLFRYLVALNTFTEPFFTLSAAASRDFIEELFGATQISNRAESLKKLISQTKEGIKEQEVTIRTITETNARINSLLDDAIIKSNDWKRTQAQIINDLDGELEVIKAIDYDLELSFFDQLDSWNVADKEIQMEIQVATREIEFSNRLLATVDADLRKLANDTSALSLEQDAARLLREANVSVESQTARLRQEMVRKEQEIARVSQSLPIARTQLVDLEAEMASPDAHSCSVCEQPLTGTNHLDKVIANLSRRATSLKESIIKDEQYVEELTASCAEIGNEITKLETEVSIRKAELEEAAAILLSQAAEIKRENEEKIAAKKLEREEPASKLDEHKASLLAAHAKYNTLPHKPSTLFNSREEVYMAKEAYVILEKEISNEIAKVNPHETQISALTATIQEINYEPMNELADLFRHQDYLLKMLTHKDSVIRKKIIDQNLTYLNGRLTHYLNKLYLPHTVTFNSDLTVDITLLGRDYDYEQFSRGERNRVIMATSWAFRDVWESLNDNINLLFIDEMLDQGFDPLGVESALSVIKSMARDRGKTVFLISHKEELAGRIDRIMLVKKENDFTRFEDSASL